MSQPKVLDRYNVFPSYKGGDTCVFGGYIYEYLPGHPLQNIWGWVAQHRMVAEDKIGRPLVQSLDHNIAEVAHHKDENRLNNHPDNIEVMTRNAHLSMHARERAERQLAKITTEMVEKALVGRTIREAAHHIGTTHMTLRRRWPELVSPRKRRSPADRNDPKWPDIIRPYAADPNWTLLATAKHIQLTAHCIQQVCQKHGILWVANRTRGKTGRPRKATSMLKPRYVPSKDRASTTEPDAR